MRVDFLFGRNISIAIREHVRGPSATSTIVFVPYTMKKAIAFFRFQHAYQHQDGMRCKEERIQFFIQLSSCNIRRINYRIRPAILFAKIQPFFLTIKDGWLEIRLELLQNKQSRYLQHY